MKKGKSKEAQLSVRNVSLCDPRARGDCAFTQSFLHNGKECDTLDKKNKSDVISSKMHRNNSALQIRHFLPTIQSILRREGRNAFEGVLSDIIYCILLTERIFIKKIDKIEHLFYS